MKKNFILNQSAAARLTIHMANTNFQNSQRFCMIFITRYHSINNYQFVLQTHNIRYCGSKMYHNYKCRNTAATFPQISIFKYHLFRHWL